MTASLVPVSPQLHSMPVALIDGPAMRPSTIVCSMLRQYSAGVPPVTVSAAELNVIPWG